MQKKDNSEDINIYEYLEILALHSVSTDKDSSYVYRKICRWFSRSFHTPLPQVIDLPVEFVLQNYYEFQFENFKEEELIGIMRYHVDPDYVESVESDDDAFFQQIKEEAIKAREAKEAKLKGKDKTEVSEKQSYDEEDLDSHSMLFEDLDENNER